MPDFSGAGLVAYGANSSTVIALGERLRFSHPVTLECGAPIYPSESKSVLRYYQRLKVGRVAQVDASLLTEAVAVFSASMVPLLGGLS
jgi:hypothetical protein